MPLTDATDGTNELSEAPAPREHIRVPRVPQEWANERMFLYAIETGDYVKVGLSKNVPQRVREMELMNPLQPNLLLYRTLTRNTAPAVEKRAHKLLAEYHHKREWFHTPPIEILRSAINKAVADGGRVDRADWALEDKRQANIEKLRARYKPGIIFADETRIPQSR